MGVIRAEPARVTDWAARSIGVDDVSSEVTIS